MNGETRRDRAGRPLRRVYHCRSYGDTQRQGGCGGVTVNAEALDWFVRETVFATLDSPQLAELLRDGERDDDKLKSLLEQRHAQQLRCDGLVDDYASGLLNKAELSRAKTKAQEVQHFVKVKSIEIECYCKCLAILDGCGHTVSV
jgi:site-specific DNA recombinase